MTTPQQPPDESSGIAALMNPDRADADVRGVGERRRSRRRGLVVAVSILLVLIVAAGGYVVWTQTAPAGIPVVVSETPQVEAPAAAVVSMPADGAAALAVAGADEYLGPEAAGVWLTTGDAGPRSIASVSKLITALVVLDAHPLSSATDPGPTITFDKADHDLYDKYYVMGATIAAMPTGTAMSLRDALATMLIPSASNYAEAVSTWAFGSQGAFVRAARDWLAAQGLSGTTIVEPTGISPRNTSTPGDLMAIARLAAANPAVAQIAATPTLTVTGPGAMRNTNSLLGQDGITGLKTGNLGEGAFSLLYTATVDAGIGRPLSVTGVVLDGFSRESVDRDVRATLDSLRGGFHDVPVASEGQEVGVLTAPWGATARLVIAESASILTWSDTPITATMQLAAPATYTDGEYAGVVSWVAGPNTVSAEVRLEGAIEPPTTWWRLTHPVDLWEAQTRAAP